MAEASSSTLMPSPISVAKSPRRTVAFGKVGHVDSEQIHGDTARDRTPLSRDDDLGSGLSLRGRG